MRHALLALALASVALPAQEQAAASQATADKTWTTEHVWPLPGCIVTGRPLAADTAKTFEAMGRTFETCCGRCQTKVEKAAETWVGKLDAAIIAAQSGGYPLGTCALCSGELGEGGQDLVLAETLVRVCGVDCAAKAKASAEETAAKVEAAAHEKQAKAYALKTCVVSGEELDPSSVTEVMCNGHLLRLCCSDCIDELKKDPHKYLSKVAGSPADAAKDAPAPAPAPEAKAKGDRGPRP